MVTQTVHLFVFKKKKIKQKDGKTVQFFFLKKKTYINSSMQSPILAEGLHVAPSNAVSASLISKGPTSKVV